MRGVTGVAMRGVTGVAMRGVTGVTIIGEKAPVVHHSFIFCMESTLCCQAFLTSKLMCNAK